MCNLILLFIPLGNDKQGKERFDNCHALGTKISPLLKLLYNNACQFFSVPWLVCLAGHLCTLERKNESVVPFS